MVIGMMFYSWSADHCAVIVIVLGFHLLKLIHLQDFGCVVSYSEWDPVVVIGAGIR